MHKLFKEQQKHLAIKNELKKLTEDKALQESMYCEEKLEEIRQLRRLEEENAEKQFHDSLALQLERKKMTEEQRKQDERLAIEIQKQKADAVREEKIRQQLRRNCPELRELQSKLLLANVSKERSVQLAEKAALKELKRLEKEEFANQMKQTKEKEKLEGRLKEEEEFQAKLKYHQDLDAQREAQEKANREAYAEFMQDRLLIDELMKKIVEEDIREAQKKIDSQRKVKQYIDEYKKAREEFELQEKLKQAEELQKVSNYLEAQEYRSQEQKELQRLKFEEQAKFQHDLIKHLDKIYEAKEKEALLRTELAIEEREELEKKRLQDIAEQRAAQQAELQNIYQMQMWYKLQKAEEEKKEEEIYRRYLMEKLAEQDKLDILSSQKRRAKQAEHRRIAHAMIEERRARIVAEREKEMAEYYKEMEMEKCRKKIVEEERRRLLQENADQLLGYLPKGVVKDVNDVKELGDCFEKFYLSRPPDSDDDNS